MGSNLPVKFRVARINEAIDELKDDFCEYIKNSEYPLEERWDVFCKAPLQLSQVTEFTTELTDMTSISNDIVEEIVEHIVVNLSYRGKVLYVNDLLEDLESSFGKSEADINVVKQELLEKNIKGFTIDW